MAGAVELEIPARPEYLALARLMVSGVTRCGPRLDDGRVDDLRLAVSEACANSIEAYQSRNGTGTDASVSVRFQIRDDRIEVDITDTAGGFDVGTLRAHPPVTNPTRLNFERGLGIPLIRALTDEAEFISSGGGTVVRLVVFAAGRVRGWRDTAWSGLE